ncbi:SDR family NAD(P)-dependent oxidoreductase [Nocardia sp. NPDC020380]|uniref:SDR family NAD(P)-dependent oxidoreductase n=1 Tax=Nocardia sp. NPDC020380 TaxID=3364309 RepID=UPI0037B0FF2E
MAVNMATDSGRQLRQMLTRALKRIEELQDGTQGSIASYSPNEPIAIIGLACRLPGGVHNAQQYWELIRSGADAVIPVPANRWEPEPGSQAYRAGLLTDPIDTMDTDFMGIAPREAAAMDPQQRLILETAWEALENAAIIPAQSNGSATGVFAGVSWQEYQRTLTPQGVASVDAHTLTGTMSSIVAGRISYLLGLRGPAIAIDTACSSSLVAIHQAVRSLQAGDCDVALAGGVNLLQSELISAALHRMNALSPTGRCRPFDAAANGYVRGEGAGMIVLKRLSQALADRDDIRAVIRGSAVNHDGRSLGLTAPSQVAQAQLLRRALAEAGCAATDIGYVETHGTGTLLGDPIEIEALREVLGTVRPDGADCLLGSVKSQIGHLESAAGIAGLIKAILVLEHETVPRQHGFTTLNPNITLQGSSLAIPTADTAWPRGDRPRYAGVSSFGFAGTNAHIILGEPPNRTPTPANEGAQLLVLSARSDRALDAQLTQWAAALPNTDSSFADVCATAMLGRQSFGHRAAVVASNAADAAHQLRTRTAMRSTATSHPPRIALLCTGQGTQYPGMGAGLYDTFPAFRTAVDECDELLGEFADGRRLRKLLLDPADLTPDRTDLAQPTLFTFEWACFRLWSAWGIEPVAVLGHSLGELVAACIAGALEPAAALRLAAERGRLMQSLPSDGAMAAVYGKPSQLSDVLDSETPGITVAAINSEDQFVISGSAAAVQRACATAAARGLTTIALPGRTAFHSPAIDPVLDDLRTIARECLFPTPQPDSTITMVSGLTGRPTAPEDLDPEYWATQARMPVRFADALRTSAQLGVDCYLELGPQPVLTELGRQVITDPGIRWMAAAAPGTAADHSILSALGELYCAGAEPTWPAVIDPGARRRTDLPTYPFERERCVPNMTAQPTDSNPAAAEQPLPSYLDEHRLDGNAVLPAAYLLLRAAKVAAPAGPQELLDFIVARPLGTSHTPVVRTAPAAVGVDVTFAATADDPIVCSAHIRHLDESESADHESLQSARSSCRTDYDLADFHNHCTTAHLDLGPSLRWITELHAGPDRLLSRLIRPATLHPSADPLQAALLDAAIQTGFALASATGPVGPPIAIDRTQLTMTPDPVKYGWALACSSSNAAGAAHNSTVDVTLYADDGTVLAILTGVRFAAAEPVPSPLLPAEPAVTPEHLFIGHEEWHSLGASASAAPQRKWRILGPSHPASAVASGLERAGHRALAVPVLPARIADDSVLFLIEAGDDADSAFRAVETALSSAQAMAAGTGRGPLLLVTHNARSNTPHPGPTAAALAGLAAVIRTELPEIGCRVIDIAAELPLDADDVISEITATDGQLIVAVRPDGRYAPTFSPLPMARDRQILDATAAYLVTGGLGALGLHTAALLADRGVRTLVLTGRSAPSAEATVLVDRLTARGIAVHCVRTDIADNVAARKLVDRFGTDLPRLGGIVHCAGVLDDGTLLNHTPERLRRIFAGKAMGAWHLHELTAGHDLDHFVLFSSISASKGTGGQAGYAAANGFLDGLARMRRASGLPATSVQWGPWATVGMASGLGDAALARWRQAGIGPLAPGDAATMWDTISTTGGVLTTHAIAKPAPAQPNHSANPAPDLLSLVRDQAAAVLQRTAPIPDRTPLRELGLDSIMAVDLRTALAEQLGIRLPATLLFDHPSVQEVAAELARRAPETPQPVEVRAPSPETVPTPDVTRQQPPDDPDAVAIIGMACRFPGGVDSPARLWQLISDEVDAITEVPAHRWNLAAHYDPDPDAEGKTYTRWGGFVDGVEDFDAGFFNISEGEARMLDPQQRLLLEVTWEALEHANHPADQVMGSATGVFAGIMSNDYAERMTRAGIAPDGWFGTGNLSSVASGRLSYFLGAGGPSLTVDTACSSSLVAVHLAVQSLRRGESDLAIAAAASVVLTPTLDIYFARARGLARDGRCKSFDAAADGVVWSDGAAALVLKRLSDARRDGDRILAVVRGSAVNSDGRSQGLSAPNGPAQETVLRAALTDARLDAADVDYVEAHGTGTALGDPIEVNALAATLAARRPVERPLLLGAVKSNIGHTQAAAGIAGIIKVVESLRHQRIPSTLHYRRGNPHIDWDDLAIRVVAEPTPWPRSARPRRAGVSAFGISGTNAHVLLEEAPPQSVPWSAIGEPAADLLVLSARTEGALRDLAARYRDHLAAHPDIPLPQLCTAMNAGRSHFECRAAVIADSIETARRGLAALADSTTAPGEVIVAADQHGVRTVELARRYLSGAAIDWATEYLGRTRYPELPTYPFQRRRHWIEVDDAPAAAPRADSEPPAARDSRTDTTAIDTARIDALRHQLTWTPAVIADSRPTGRWLVFSDSEPGDALAAGLTARGADVVLVRPGSEFAAANGRYLLPVEDPSGFARLLAQDSATAVVYAWCGGSAQTRLTAALQLTRALVAHGRPATSLWLVTVGAQYAAATDRPSPEQAMMWGFGRTLAAEHPELRCRLLDLAPERVDSGHATAILCDAGDEAQFALRGDRTLAGRTTNGPWPSDAVVPDTENYRFTPDPSGEFAALRGTPADRIAPDPEQLEIEVAATGLNFRDILLALGAYPDGPSPLGFECAGRVNRIGAGEQEFRVGDRVMALTGGSLARYVTVDRRLTAAIPEGMSFTTAASIPMAFTTAWYALFDLAAVGPGTSVLAHAAAGGVGMAAVQLARRAGAQVFATAAPAKWPAVRALGLPQVYSSRESGFAAAIRARTGGTGVDVVLNSLTGSFIDEGIGLLNPGGRFVELGKTDVRSPDTIAADRPDVRYRAFDLNEAGPDRLGTILREVAALIAHGELTPLPLATYPMSAVEPAFRTMSQGGHIGKIVLCAAPAARVVADGTYLVTGGFGGLGAAAARWLVARGARHLALIGRGGPGPEGRALVEELTTMGVRVLQRRIDIGERAAVAGLLTELSDSDMPVLRGVIHCAGVLDDALVTDQEWSRFEKVLGPKYEGAQHLDELTRNLPLDLFIMYSSVAGLLGSPGQANYAAANAALDALAWRRRADGLPALSVAWGPFAEVGMAASQPGLLDRLAQRGFPALTVADADAALDRLLRIDPATTGVFATSDAIVTATTAKVDTRSVVQWIVMRLLDLPAEVDPDRPLRDIGVDSLTSLELRNALSTEIGRTLPPTLVFDHPTIRAIAALVDRTGGVPAAAPNAPTVTTPASAADVAEPAMSDDDSDDPIVIVGMSCRFPGGANSPELLWDLLSAGRDAITEVPADRWDIDAVFDEDPTALGTMYTRWGGFLDQCDQFDPEFFDMAATEAKAVDPQHRLLLETSWEALERAGYAPGSLVGSRTGVFVGLCFDEYPGTRSNPGTTGAHRDPTTFGPYFITGTARSIAAGRVAYCLGLQGPALTLDTACSSSLVALQSAVDSLRAGRCDLALVGGVNLQLDQDTTIAFCRLGALSPDGQCRAFDADAKGYVRADGCGVVVAERLSAARRHGHPVLAVVRGIAVNHDGRSNGLTAPNGPAQERVIAEALDRAGVSPADVGYVEAHGTGTPLGDPIEAGALASAYGAGRTTPLLIGSIKGNIGHTEGAAGVAGLIKAVLMMQHGEIPPSLHFDNPNPHIDWDAVPLEVVRERRHWPISSGPRLTAVSSFGMSGTNAHVVLQEPTPVTASAPDTGSHQVLVLSARSGEALTALAQSWADALADDPGATAHPDGLGDFAYTAAAGRTHFEDRLAIVADSRADATVQLRAAATGTADDHLVARGRVERAAPRPVLALLFTGQGSQYPGMARDLFDAEPVFAAAMRQCDEIVGPIADPGSPANSRRLLDVVFDETSGAQMLARTVFAQPALFAVEWSLWQLWRDWGIEPAAVLGHSVGEYVAACAAGALEVTDALRLVALRGRLMQGLPESGEMLAVTGDPALTASATAEADAVSVAAFNGPEQVVVAGRAAALRQLGDRLRAMGMSTTPLSVSHAFHSPLMEPMLADLISAAERIQLSDPAIPLISNVTGVPLAAGELTAEYFARHTRRPVQFAAGMQALAGLGTDMYLEIGPHPILSALGQRCVEQPARFVPSLRRGQDALASMGAALAQLYTAGIDIDWEQVHRPHQRRRIIAPTYTFQRRHCWLDLAPAPAHASAPHVTAPHVTAPVQATALDHGGSPDQPDVSDHPVRVDAPAPLTRFSATVGPDHQRYLRDHVIDGRVLLPASWYLTAIVRAARSMGAERGNALRLTDLQLHRAVELTDRHRLALDFHPAEGHFTVEAGPAAGAGQSYLTARLTMSAEIAPPPDLDLEGVRARCPDTMPSKDFYASLAASRLSYGPAFQQARGIRTGRREGLVTLSDPYGDTDIVHPAVLDSAFHTILAALDADARLHTWVPFAIDSVTVYGRSGTARFGHARVVEQTGAAGVYDVEVLDAAGRVLLAVGGMRLIRIDATAPLHGSATTGTDASAAVDTVPRATNSAVTRFEHLVRQAAGLSDTHDLDLPLSDAAINSLAAVELRDKLAYTTGLRLPMTLAYEYPTPRALVDYLVEQTAATQPTPRSEPRPDSRPAPGSGATRPSRDGDIAIVGMAGRYPGAADLTEFWQVLATGRDCITEIPSERWNPDDYFDPDRNRPHTSYSRWGGFLDDVDCFDPLFFAISPREAELLDPQERLFLQIAWAALENAGHTADDLFRNGLGHGEAGVFAGVMWGNYQLFAGDPRRLGHGAVPSSTYWSIANRVSHALDFRGPSMAVDTACSSSLTALHLACQSLRTGECRLAIAGGVNLTTHPYKYLALSQGKYLSTDGRCRSFGAGGDGYVPGEGVGAVVLRPLADAEADGDTIHAVIKGTAINHGGHVTGFTVPNPEAHAEVIRAALRSGDIDPATISYIEAHGTGTALGDPIEIAGLSRVFGAAIPGSCLLGSVKSNIGHTEAAAGIAALTKVVLQLGAGMIAPSLHSSPPNPAIDFSATPFRVPDRLVPWPSPESGRPRRAVINSFGAGGSNAHVIIEEYLDTRMPTPVSGPHLIPLSARDPERLAEYVARLHGFLTTEQPDLADTAHTLQRGRIQLPTRALFTATTVAELADQLAAWPAQPSANRDPRAHRWLAGEPVDWRPSHEQRRQIALPTYPFARERYWLPDITDTAATDDSTPQVLVPRWREAPAPVDTLHEHRVIVLCDEDTPAALRNAVAATIGGVDRLVTVGSARRPTAAGKAFPEYLDRNNFADGAHLGRAMLAHHRDTDCVIDLCDLAPLRGSTAGSVDFGRIGFYQGVFDAHAGAVTLLHVCAGLPGVDGPEYAPLAGLAAGLAREFTDISTRSVYFADSRASVAADPDRLLRVLGAECAWTDDGPRVRYRGAVREVPELAAAQPTGSVRIDPEGVYVITGGTRGLGAQFASMLVDRGVRRLALLGRAPLPPEDQWDRLAVNGDPSAGRVRSLRALRERGATVRLYSGPLTDRAALRDFFGAVRTELGPIAGVLHCAGIASAESPAFVHKTGPGIAEVAEPKIAGLAALAEALDTDRPDFFVLFSSVAAIVPTLAVGLSDYAMANAHLDRFAEARRAAGHAEVRSVQWPSFRDGGLREITTAAYGATGLPKLAAADGLRLLEAVLAVPNEPVLLPYLGPDPTLTLRTPPRSRAATNGGTRRPASNGTTPRPAAYQDLLRIFSEELKLPQTRFEPDRRFEDYGADSVLIASVVRRIEGLVDEPVDPATVLEYPTLQALSELLAERYPHRFTTRATTVTAKATTAEAAPVSSLSPGQAWKPVPTAQAPIAVVGIGCRLPGGDTPDDFWRLLAAGECAVREVDPARWDPARYYAPEPRPGRTVSKLGGFLTDIDLFDPDYFGLTEPFARQMDPLQRLMLEVSAGAVADAGYEPNQLAGGRIGVYVGCRSANYFERMPVPDRHTLLGTGQNFIAARISDHFDWHAANMVIDSACSSSLVAVHLACQALRTGELDAALVGGVEVLLDEMSYLTLSAAGVLSPNGLCRTFDQNADGFVPGEGAAALLLKPLDAAMRDGDQVYAVLRGSAVGNDGHTMGFTTPNLQAQISVITGALRAAGAAPDELSYVEAHGTGTMIGDPIELKALATVLGSRPDKADRCAVGSVKTNIGHLLGASGIAGAVKTILAVRNGLIPPSLHCPNLNPRFRFDGSPLYVNREPTPWITADGRHRLAGVSSFGFGGTNAHLIVEQAPPGYHAARIALPPPRFVKRRLLLPKRSALPLPALAERLPMLRLEPLS